MGDVVGISGREGRIQTVRGLIDPAEAGPTLMHEHVISDLGAYVRPHPDPEIARMGALPLTPEWRHELLSAPLSSRDNVRLDSEPLAIDEILRFQQAGGTCIVECTTDGIGRDPTALHRISERTNVHISMGAGIYRERSHPPHFADASDEEIAHRFVAEIDIGVGETGIRCGHIGEIGCHDLTPAELKVVRAAARAQRATGAMLNIHQAWVPGDPPTGHQIADAIEGAGGDLERTVFSHMDGSGASPVYQDALLRRGIILEFDLFGVQYFDGSWARHKPHDLARILDVRSLVERGWVRQIVLSQDICQRMMLVTYGGWGYAHILRRIVPGLEWAGLSPDEIRTILVENPRRLLAFAPAHEW